MRMNYLDSIIDIKPKRKYTTRLDYKESNEDETEVDDENHDEEDGDMSSKNNKIRKIDEF